MGAGRVVGGAARTTGRGARMARRMFRRKGKNPKGNGHNLDANNVAIKKLHAYRSILTFGSRSI